MNDLLARIDDLPLGLTILAFIAHGAAFRAMARGLRWKPSRGLWLAILPTLSCFMLAYGSAVGGGVEIALYVPALASSFVQVFLATRLLRDDLPELKRRYFSENGVFMLALLFAIPAASALAAAITALILQPNSGFAFKSVVHWNGGLPAAFPRSRPERLILLLLALGSVAGGQFLLFGGNDLIESLLGVGLFGAAVLCWRRLPTAGNRLIVGARGVSELSSFRLRHVAWKNIERFEVTTTHYWVLGAPYEVGRARWVPKSGQNYTLSSKFGHWPEPLADFLNERLADFRAAHGNAPVAAQPTTPTEHGFIDRLTDLHPARIVLFGIAGNIAAAVAILAIAFGYHWLLSWLESQPPLFG